MRRNKRTRKRKRTLTLNPAVNPSQLARFVPTFGEAIGSLLAGRKPIRTAAPSASHPSDNLAGPDADERPSHDRRSRD